MCHDNKRGESTQQKCGHFNLAPYGCEHCFKSHEEIAAERDASKRDENLACGYCSPFGHEPTCPTNKVEIKIK
jgi:hypothetical protein